MYVCACGVVCTCVYANMEARNRLGVFLDHFQSFLTQERSLTLELTDWLASWRSTCLPSPSARVTDMCYLPSLAFVCMLGLTAQLLMFAQQPRSWLSALPLRPLTCVLFSSFFLSISYSQVL